MIPYLVINICLFMGCGDKNNLPEDTAIQDMDSPNTDNQDTDNQDTDSNTDTGTDTGTTAETTKEWCKAQTHTWSYSGGDSGSVTYEWDGNTQMWDGNHTIYNDMGYVIENVVSGTTLLMEYDCNETWCKSTYVYQDNGAGWISESNYTWDGNTAIDDAGNIYEYNDMGYMTGTTFSTYSADFTYDCNETWCKQITYTTYYDDGSNTTVTSTWNGNDMVDSNGNSGSYNDWGYVLHQVRFGSFSDSYTYICE